MSHEGQEQKLVYMANQIATFFASRPDDQAIAEISSHIKKFWAPRMRTKIIAHVQHGGAGLSELASAAVKRLEAPAQG